jgi:hypothetical protein
MTKWITDLWQQFKDFFMAALGKHDARITTLEAQVAVLVPSATPVPDHLLSHPDVVAATPTPTTAPVPAPVLTQAPAIDLPPAPVPRVEVPFMSGIVDATGWLPGGVSDLARACRSRAGEVVSFKFTAAQLITGAPSKRGWVQLYETAPGAQFEISNQPGSMTIPLPAANDPATFTNPARLDVATNRFPQLSYAAKDSPIAPIAGANSIAILGEPDAGGFYYVNVKQAIDSGYTIFYQQQ